MSPEAAKHLGRGLAWSAFWISLALGGPVKINCISPYCTLLQSSGTAILSGNNK